MHTYIHIHYIHTCMYIHTYYKHTYIHTYIRTFVVDTVYCTTLLPSLCHVPGSMWDALKGWLDPRTQAKVEFVRSGPDTGRKLLEFIEPPQLPKVQYR